MPYEFNHTVATPLCEIMGRNKSDKGSLKITTSWHNYTTCYNHLFKDIRMNSLRVFELGLGTNNPKLPSSMGVNGRPGASLFGWNEFFPNAKIYGADIDGDILFETEQIKTFYCDQTNKYVIKYMWNDTALTGLFDIIIDDGLHEVHSNVCFFENSIHKLAVNGYYIIEDVSNGYLPEWESILQKWRSLYPNLSIEVVSIPSTTNNYDNNLIVIRRLA